jgi:hypothetical protein
MTKFSIYKIKKNPYRYFLFKLAIFFVLVFVIDFSIGNILRYFYFKQESGLQFRTSYSIEKTTADVLIFGSSRANHHYDPNVFEKRFNLTYYNVGRDGNYMLYHTAVLKGVLKRYSPKIVILDLNGREFQKKDNGFDYLSSLLPYYKAHPEMRSIIELKSRFEKVKMLSFIYPYNSSMFTIAVGNTEFNKKRRGDIQGYVPLTKVWNGTIQIDSSWTNYEIDSIKVKAYETFIKNCIQSKVELYIVCSPYYIKFNHSDISVKLGQEIAKRNSIEFFDYSNDTTFTNNSKLFADKAHLNETGAKVFSNLLINSIGKTNESEPTATLITSPNSKIPD